MKDHISKISLIEIIFFYILGPNAVIQIFLLINEWLIKIIGKNYVRMSKNDKN